MSEHKSNIGTNNDDAVVKLSNFWTKYSKKVTVVAALVILLGGGWFAYQQFYLKPREASAIEAMFRAEEYYRKDSASLALNGDGQSLGFIKIAEKFSGTKAAELANFYAGSCYIKLNENAKAIEVLKGFSCSSDLVQARSYKLLADAYAETNKNEDALSYYKKAGHYFEKDEVNSPEYLFYGAYFAAEVMKNNEEAISLYKEIKNKYPRSQQAYDADKYLAKLGVYTSEN
jgi:tetratricopeptide (TPR) repeat protein